MSIVRTLARNTLIQFGGKIVSTILGLVALAIMTRYLGLSPQFGWYATAVGFLQFVGILCDFGFTVTMSNMAAEPQFQKRAVLNTLFTWRLITALIVHGLAPFVFLLFPYPAPVKHAVFIMSASFLAVALQSVFIGYYRAELKMWVATVGENIGRLLLLAGVALVAYFNWGFLATMGVITVTSIISTLYLYVKIGGVRLQIDRAVTRVMFRKMWPTALAVIFNALYLQGDRVILPLYVSEAEVGLYGASYRVLDIAIQLSAMLMGLVMPLITYAWARHDRAEFSRRYQLAFDLMALLLLPITVGIFVLAGPLMRFVAGPEFTEAGYILKGLSLSIIGLCFGMVFGHIALAVNRQRQALWVYICDAALSLTGYFIFIPRYGVRGAIGVTIFSEWFAGLALMAITIYYAKQAPRLRTLGKIILASLLMGAAVWAAMPTGRQARGAAVVWAIALGVAVFSVLALLFKIISPETLRDIFRRPEASRGDGSPPDSIAQNPPL